MRTIRRRDEHSAVHDTSVPEQDWPVDVSPLLRRVYRARGGLTHAQAQPRLNQLLPPDAAAPKGAAAKPAAGKKVAGKK